eukprot:4997146-Pleurochrysis_carterae.AAC.1
MCRAVMHFVSAASYQASTSLHCRTMVCASRAMTFTWPVNNTACRNRTIPARCYAIYKPLAMNLFVLGSISSQASPTALSTTTSGAERLMNGPSDVGVGFSVRVETASSKQTAAKARDLHGSSSEVVGLIDEDTVTRVQPMNLLQQCTALVKAYLGILRYSLFRKGWGLWLTGTLTNH